MFLGLQVSFPSYASQVYKASEQAKAAFQKDVFLCLCHILAIPTKTQVI
jgi:predicted oxidoreductase (fatty acid repression mutant protein)